MKKLSLKQILKEGPEDISLGAPEEQLDSEKITQLNMVTDALNSLDKKLQSLVKIYGYEPVSHIVRPYLEFRKFLNTEIIKLHRQLPKDTVSL